MMEAPLPENCELPMDTKSLDLSRGAVAGQVLDLENFGDIWSWNEE